MKKVKFALLLVFLLLFSSLATYVILEVIDDKKDDNSTEIEEPIEDEVETEKPKEDTWNSPLSGKETTEEISKRRPVAIIFDNHPSARWQAGLKDAEIVYEFPVESPYTRYIGLFLLNEPESLGPIRSTRPYLVQTIASYDPIFVRCGGSEDGKREVQTYDIADVDCLESKAFTRSSSKKAPNNLYISMNSIRKEQERLGYNNRTNFEGYNFTDEDTDISGDNGETIKISYNANNNTKYEYNQGEKTYKRYKDGQEHVDESDRSNISAKNIIIQQANSRVLDNEGRKKIDIIGSGQGMYITNGKVKNISWQKSSAREKTIFSDSDGEISLNLGTTWIQIVEPTTDIVID